MDREDFWSVIDRARPNSTSNAELIERLRAELTALSLDEVASYQSHFEALFDDSYGWSLWAAAYLIGGGCSDDSFMDFRGWLITQGRDVYEAAHADPESLATAELAHPEEDAFLEDVLYLGPEIFSSKGGGELARAQTPPAEPSGSEWEEDALAELCPRLSDRFGFAANAPVEAPEPTTHKKSWWKFW